MPSQPKDPNIPEVKGYLGYSTGRHGRLDPFSFRSCNDALERVFFALPRIFPAIGQIFGRPPLLISCYPAFLGIMHSIPVVDTYLRQSIFSRALILAVETGRSVILLGQPLSTAEMLLRHKLRGERFPEQVLVALGGYYCPASLEAFVLHLLSGETKNTTVIHGYGVAEVGAGCFIGMRENAQTDILYQSISPDVCVEIASDGRLSLKLSGDEVWIDTGDYFRQIETPCGTRFLLKNSEHDLSVEVLKELESWTSNDWARRTGYVEHEGDRLSVQLRVGERPGSSVIGRSVIHWLDQIEYFDYLRRYGSFWAEKPMWGSKGGQ